MPYGFLAIIDVSVSNGSDSPSEFTAKTLKEYSFPGVRPVTSKSTISY